MESRFYYSVTRISTIEFCIICHTLQLVRLTRRSVSKAIREASLIGFYVCSLCVNFLCVIIFLYPLTSAGNGQISKVKVSTEVIECILS